MTEHAKAVDLLLSLPAGRTLLTRWHQSLPPQPGDPFTRAEQTLLEYSREDPGRMLLAAQRVKTALRGVATRDQESRLARLRGHGLRLTGRPRAAAAAYAEAVRGFVAGGDPLEAGLTGIGWVDALNLAGDPGEALRVGRRSLARLPRGHLGRARLETNLATTLYTQGAFAEAATRYDRARRRFLRAGEAWSAALAEFNLANAWHRLGRSGDARRAYRHAGEVFSRQDARVPALYARHGLAALDLAQGRWEDGARALDEVTASLREVGDQRAEAAMEREMAELLASMGAFAAAAPYARRAVTLYGKLGLDAEGAHAGFLEGRVFAATGSHHDAQVRFEQAIAHWRETQQTWSLRVAEIDLAAVEIARGAPEAALTRLRRALRYLDARDPHGHACRARARMAEAHLLQGRAGLAARLAVRAHRDARHHPARWERPYMSLLLARAESSRGRGNECLRAAKRAVAELERQLRRFGSRSLRRESSAARDRLYPEAVELVLTHGGAAGARTALDLVSRARSPQLIEDMLHRHTADADVVAALVRLRDALLAPQDPGNEDVRFRGLRREAARLEQRLSREPRRGGKPARQAEQLRRLSSWRRRLGDSQLVLFARSPGAWRGYVVRRTGPVRWVDLPLAEPFLRQNWSPFRLALETAARAPRPRRAAFLHRTADEAHSVFADLRRAFWDPLPLSGAPVILIPTGELHGLPLEAAAAGKPSITRLPHPALVLRPPSRKGGRALVLSDRGTERLAERDRVAAALRRGGWQPSRGTRRRDLQRHAGRPLGVLHVAAHGAYHPRDWLLSGVRLSDGWVGLDQLAASRLRGALLYLGSCESGLAPSNPGAEFEGWLAAGFGAGAREMVLSLWKVDDAGAGAFADAFYAAWTRGASAAEAARGAREQVRARYPHPFSWAPFIAAG